MDPTTSPAGVEGARVPRGALLFCAALVLVGCIYLGIAVKRLAFPPPQPEPMPVYDLADEAQKYLRQSKPKPLSDKLAEILAEAERVHFATQPHPLLGQTAPDFTRPDAAGHDWSLRDALRGGPVIVVFYLGYHCNHCVSQLFDLNEDIERFRELGVQVIALSPDSAELTRERYREYGSFQFPVLSDPENQIARAFGVYTPAMEGKPEDLLHGTFVLDQKGVVHWAATGAAPFGHNPTLVYEIAKIKGMPLKD
jgi:peroxiredoxin Q/BCP